MLGTAGTEVEHIDGADAPRVIVTVLPVEETIFPDPTIVVPLTHSIAVGVSKLVDFVMSTAATCLIIRKIGHQGVADDTSHRHTAGYHHGVATDAQPVAVTIGQRKSSLYGKIDSPTRPAAVGVGAGQEGAGSPLRGVLHIAVTVRIAGDGVASVKGGAVIEGACRNEDVDDSPYRTLHKQQEDMPYGIFQETPGQHVYPRPHTITALLVVGRRQHLEEQVVDARNTMDEDIVYDGVGEPQRGGNDIHHHRDDLCHHTPSRLAAVGEPVLLEKKAPRRHQKMLQPVEEIDGERDNIIGSEEDDTEDASQMKTGEIKVEVETVEQQTDAYHGRYHQTHYGSCTTATAKDSKKGGSRTCKKTGIDNQLNDILPQRQHQQHSDDYENPSHHIPHSRHKLREATLLLLCNL